jgi:capsular polysaccharide biosynthesis protein
MAYNDVETEWDAGGMMKVLKKRLWLIALITVIAVGIGGGASFYLMKPVFETKISIVIGKIPSQGVKSQYDYNDIMMLQNLLKTYAEIASSRAVAARAINTLQLIGVSPENLLNQMSVVPQMNTQIIDLKVKNGNAVTARDVANGLANAFIEESKRIFPSGNVQIIDEAIVPENPISPNKKIIIAISFLLGLLVSIGLVYLIEYLDNTVKTEGDVEKYICIPVIGIIPKNV